MTQSKFAAAGLSLATLALVFLHQACGVSGFTAKKFELASLESDFTVVTEPPDSSVTEGGVLYKNNCAACHGELEQSTKLGKTSATIKTAILDVPNMKSLSRLSDSEIERIAKALNPASNKTGGANPFACMSGDDPGATDFKRLSRREYLLTLEMLFGGHITLSEIKDSTDQLPADVVENVFDTSDSSITAAHLDAYFTIAKRASTLAANRSAWLNSVLACSYETSGMSDACWENYFNNFARVAYRRPLTTAERADIKLFYNTNADSSVRTGLQAVTASILQSPFFLYKVENEGSPVGQRRDLLKISDYELASRLAFLITGRGPSRSLLDAVKAGKLSSTSDYSVLVNELFATPQAKEHVTEFYTQWLGGNKIPASSHSSWFLNGINPSALREDALRELQDFTSALTWTGKGTYKDLLTSEESFVKGETLARLYSTSAPPTQGLNLSIKASEMTASVGRAEMGGWNLFSNGTLKKQVSLALSQSTVVTVRAKADLLRNVGAVANVSFGSQRIAVLQVSSATYSDYKIEFKPTTAQADLVIEFTNDDYDSATGLDRNLYVEGVTVSQGGSASQNLPTLPLAQRVGIMSRLAFLMSGTNQTSLVHRGLVVRKHILCDKISPPMITSDNRDAFLAPEPDPTQSLRTQIEKRTSPTSCQGCHAMINPAGFVLEHYDALSRYQTEERVFDSNGNILARHPVNARVRPNIESANEPEVNGLPEMAQAIAQSSKGPACASQQWFTYTKGRSPSSADSCLLSNLFISLMDANRQSLSGDAPATLLNMMKTPAFDSSIRVRKFEPLAP